MSQHNHEHLTGAVYRNDRKVLILTLLITASFMAFEFIGGILSGSLALMSDAAHMLTDTGALILALCALWFSRRPANNQKTFGFYRTEILSALINGSLLIFISGFIYFEAFKRIFNPSQVQGELMLGVALVGLMANLIGAYILTRGGKENLNIKAALWHVLSDALSSVGVIIGAIVITFTNFYLIDPILSFVIGAIIFRGAIRVVNESIEILLEAVPKDIDINDVINAVKQIAGVKDAHDLHVWTITSGYRALSAHILVDDNMVSHCADVSNSIKSMLLEKYHIEHVTLEFECVSCKPGTTCN